MKKILLILLLSAAVFSTAAQDGQMVKMMNTVRSLRSGGKASFEAAAEAMSADKSWTPMNELHASSAAECRASDRVPGFKLNKMLAAAEQKRRFEVAAGNMLNGESANFKYSLYERAVKAASTLTYTLRARSGQQCFVVMPYDALKSAGLSVSVSAGGRTLPMTAIKDAYVFTGRVNEGETVKVDVVNSSSKPRSFVILNHNSRK